MCHGDPDGVCCAQIESSRPACRYFLRGECRYSSEDCPFLHPENWEDIEICAKGKRCKRGKSCGYRHCQRTGKIRINQRKLNPLPNKAMMEKGREIQLLKGRVQWLEQQLAQTKRPETDTSQDLPIAVKLQREEKQEVRRSNKTQRWIEVVPKGAKKEKGRRSGQPRSPTKDNKENYRNRFSHLCSGEEEALSAETEIQEPVTEDTKPSDEEEAPSAETEELASGKTEFAEEDQSSSQEQSGEAAMPPNVDQTCPGETGAEGGGFKLNGYEQELHGRWQMARARARSRPDGKKDMCKEDFPLVDEFEAYLTALMRSKDRSRRSRLCNVFYKKSW